MTQEAIIKVLKMLEKGKISAEEAQKLIAEINMSADEKQTRPYREGKKDHALSDMIGNVIGTALGTAENAIRNATDSIHGMFGSYNEKIPVNDRVISIICAGSNLEVVSGNTEDIELSINGLKPKVMCVDDEIKIKISAASGEIVLPENSTASLKLDGSNCDISTSGGHYMINSAGSDINLDASAGINNLKGRFTACKLDLSFDKNCSCHVMSRNGTVKYPRDDTRFSENSEEVTYGNSPFVIDIDSTAGMCELSPCDAENKEDICEHSDPETLKKGKKTIQVD